MTPYDYALLAQEAYSARPDIGRADSASRAIVRQTAAGLVVAFPGTDNNECFLADIDILTTLVPDVGRIHRGFWDAWKQIAQPVLDVVKGKPVTFVGHSLGAALSIVAAVGAKLVGEHVVTVYGFEPPRVSPDDSVGKFLIGVPLCLFKNGRDIVVDVPFGWDHPGAVNHIGQAVRPFPNIEDHMLARVLTALKTLA